jgi:hypothetical protein
MTVNYTTVVLHQVDVVSVGCSTHNENRTKKTRHSWAGKMRKEGRKEKKSAEM